MGKFYLFVTELSACNIIIIVGYYRFMFYCHCVWWKSCFSDIYRKIKIICNTLRDTLSGKQLSNSFCLLSENVVNSKKEEIATLGSKFFPVRVDSFQKGLGLQESQQELKQQNSSSLLC